MRLVIVFEGLVGRGELDAELVGFVVVVADTDVAYLPSLHDNCLKQGLGESLFDLAVGWKRCCI